MSLVDDEMLQELIEMEMEAVLKAYDSSNCDGECAGCSGCNVIPDKEEEFISEEEMEI